MLFDVADIAIEAIKKKAACAVNAINELMTDPELKKVYDESKSAADNILQNELPKCTKTKDIDHKVR